MDDSVNDISIQVTNGIDSGSPSFPTGKVVLPVSVAADWHLSDGNSN
jgi:hypothetical protein